MPGGRGALGMNPGPRADREGWNWTCEEQTERLVHERAAQAQITLDAQDSLSQSPDKAENLRAVWIKGEEGREG